MGKCLLLLTLLGDVNTTPPEYRGAISQLRYALLATPMVKSELEQLQTVTEKTLYRHTGLTKEDLVYGAYMYPIVAGKVSTKPFKNFKYSDGNGFTIRPDVEYNFRDKNYDAVVVFIKEF